MAIGPNRVPGRCDVPPSNGAPTTTTSAAASAVASSRSTRSTPRKVMSGPNCGPYRVMHPLVQRIPEKSHATATDSLASLAVDRAPWRYEHRRLRPPAARREGPPVDALHAALD